MCSISLMTSQFLKLWSGSWILPFSKPDKVGASLTSF